MPRRSERSGFPEAFSGNPFAGFDAGRVYTELRWGDAPTEEWDIDAPEPLASLGELAMLDLVEREQVIGYAEGRGPWVAVGVQSNLVYLLPRARDGGPPSRVPTPLVPRLQWRDLGEVRQTDYLSTKDGQDAYYYHEHERPYPRLWEHVRTRVRVLVPAVHRGKRSYGVVREGIVG